MDSLAQVATAASLLQLNLRFKAALVEHGFEHFAGGSIVDGHRPARMFLQDWPQAWMQEYAANGYAASDPALPRALASPEPFTLVDLLATDPDNRVLAAVFAFGWRHGLIVPVHGPGQKRGLVALVTLQTRKGQEDRKALQELAMTAYRRGYILTNAQLKSEPLPARQREVLLLASCGMTDHEIGARLRISNHTAHSHIESAKRRLGARSRAQAIALATERQLL